MLFFFSFLLGLTNNVVNAEELSKKYVIVSGESIGLKIDTGVYVAGKYEVKTSDNKASPWLMSDIEVGDKIIKYNDTVIENANDLIEKLKNEQNTQAKLTMQRNKKTFITSIKIVETSQGNKSIGLYLKDKLLGVGTMTFIDPDSKVYGSLGHGIYDQKIIVGDVDGTLTYSNVESIKKGKSGTPGEKRASLQKKEIGCIKSNNITGVYGKIGSTTFFKNAKKMQVAKQSEVIVGPAKIMTVVEGNNVETFDIEIVEVNRQSTRNIKGLKIKVTDQNLIDRTGGIIQGMSGSPIIQNKKLVGAVSHVIVDNPIYGYGIHIEWMLDEVANYKY